MNALHLTDSQLAELREMGPLGDFDPAAYAKEMYDRHRHEVQE